MKKILLCFLSFMFISNVYASCDYQKEAELSRIASNVQISYTYKIIDDRASFDVTLTNLTKDIYVSGSSYINTNGEYTTTYDQGQKLTFKFYSNECGDKLLLTKYLTLPTYNKYYSTDECKESPKFKYCEMWDNLDISEIKFQEEYDNYTYTKKNNQSVEDEYKNVLLDVMSSHIKEIIVSIIGVIILIIILILKLNKKRVR